MNLKIDLERVKEGFRETGIFVRAQDENGKWKTTDIVHLDAESLLAWLRSRGGQNVWAEETVGVLLGHQHSLHAETVQATDTPPRKIKPVEANFIDDIHDMLEAYAKTKSFPCQRTGVHMYSMGSDICYWCKEERPPERHVAGIPIMNVRGRAFDPDVPIEELTEKDFEEASREKERVTSGYPKWCGKCGYTINEPGPCPMCDDKG